MSQMEHLLNVYASRVARGHCADFLGYCEVVDSEATVRLTSGLWLVWKYEGSKTLAYYLRRRDTLRALAQDLEVPEAVALPTVMKHILEGLAAFHAAGLVHRDIKPLNMIFAEDVRRFKLIDLGACADLRTGTNYVPEESILDLNFCPPEQYVMPTDSPHIAKQAGFIKLAISPMLWAKHKPDRFDTWSAGIIMLQLAVPSMRSDRALRAFNSVYGSKYKYSLSAWRKAIHLPARDCELLDADEGSGWDMLQSLLAPRHIQVDDNGGVSFVNDTPFQRISAFEALKHKYVKSGQEAVTVSQATTASGNAAASRSSLSSYDIPAAPRKGKAGGGAAKADELNGSSKAVAGPATDPVNAALGIWRDMTGRLFDLEARLMRQTSATELQTTTVKRLKEQVDSGRTDPAVLKKEEKVLDKMQARLSGLQQEFTSTANQASGIFSFFGLGGKPQEQQAQEAKSAGPKPGAEVRGSVDRLKPNSQPFEAASASSSSDAGSTFPSVSAAAGMFTNVWERLSNRLGDLEQKISNQASATERQSLVVLGLRAKVKMGEADPAMLNKAEQTLSRMERRLLDLDRDYRVAKQSVKGALAGNVSADTGGKPRTGSREQSATGVAEAVAAAHQALQGESDIEASGSFWSRLLGAPGRNKSGSSGSSIDGSSKEATPPAVRAGSAAASARQQEPQRARTQSPLFRSKSPFAVTGHQNSAQQQQAQPKQQTSQQPPPATYRSIFGSFGGSTSTSSADLDPKLLLHVVTPAAAAEAAGGSAPSDNKTSRTRSATPRNTGGFLGSLFGNSRQPQPPAAGLQPVPQAGATAPPRVQSGKPPAAVALGPATLEASTSGPAVPLDPPPSAGTGDALVEGASRVIRGSLGFTGLAAKIAGDMATAFKADAERYFKDLEVQEAAKRQQRVLDLAFVALLREAHPPVRSRTSYEQALGRFSGEASWAALTSDMRRRELFAKYQQTAAVVEEQAVIVAEANYRAALRRYNVTATSNWEDFLTSLPDLDPTLLAVEDPARRQQLFLEVIAEVQLQATLQAAAQKAEVDFTALLAELRDPPVTSTSTWSVVRRAVAADPRSQALSERRRRELFEAFAAMLLEADIRSQAQDAVMDVDIAMTSTVEVADPVAPGILTGVLAKEGVDSAAAAGEQEVPMASAVEAEGLPAADVRVYPNAPLQTAPGPYVVAPSSAELQADSPSPATVMASAAVQGPAVFAAMEDDELSAALAGMEAALETAMKAVSSPPLSSPSSRGGGGGNNVVTVPPAHFHGAIPLNGAAKTTPLSPATGSFGGEGIRLEELRREQARLRSEYEAMASRLREMEERLKSQAQFMSAVDEPGPQLPLGDGAGTDGISNGMTHSGGSVLIHSNAGGNGGGHGEMIAHGSVGNAVHVKGGSGNDGAQDDFCTHVTSNDDSRTDNGNGVSNSETYTPARGQRWR